MKSNNKILYLVLGLSLLANFSHFSGAVPDDPDVQLSSNSPAIDGASVTPSDSVNFERNSRGIYVGTGGTGVFVFASGRVLTFKNLISGANYPYRLKRVNATGTTAADMNEVW